MTNKYTIEQLRLTYTDQGFLNIKRNMGTLIHLYGFEKFYKDLGVDFKDVKEFLIGEPMYGYKVVEKLDKALQLLNTNLDSLSVSIPSEQTFVDTGSTKN